MERADAVLADLTAHSRRGGALVDVLAGFSIGHEAVARVTGAVIAGEGVCAELSALMDLCVQTLIDS